MASLRVHPGARGDLDSLIDSHSLPPDTRERVRKSLAPLRDFPLLGSALAGRWASHRFILGPWRWMVIVYSWSEKEDAVTVMAIEDARSATSPTQSRA